MNSSDPVLELVRSADPLAAGEPWPAGPERLIAAIVAQDGSPRCAPRRPRARFLALAMALVVVIPAVAFADTIGGLLGFSNQGTTVAANDTPFTDDPDLYAAMQQMGLTTMQFLGERDGIGFYAARNPEGHFCFAISSPGPRGVGCRLDNVFPSIQDPLIDWSSPGQIEGFAADDVTEIAVLDAGGDTLATIPVSGNIYALTDPPAGAVSIEALGAGGNVIATRSLQ
jgi:hypothetical protein